MGKQSVNKISMDFLFKPDYVFVRIVSVTIDSLRRSPPAMFVDYGLRRSKGLVDSRRASATIYRVCVTLFGSIQIYFKPTFKK